MRCALLLIACSVLGCGQSAAPHAADGDDTTATSDTPPSPSSTAGTSQAASDQSAATTTAAPTTTGDTSGPTPPRCEPGLGTTGSPTTVIEVVQLINGLPHPVTIPCFLEALVRPLRVMAAASFISAQPSFGTNNPRLFILGDGISLTLVAAGTGKDLLEMGELTSNTHSIKAELEFPVTEPLGLDAAFTHVRSEIHNGTVCFGCHNDETEALDYPVAGAFESVAYRPLPELEVDLAQVKTQFTSCDASVEPERCAFYTALFGHGEVLADRFPDEMPLFQ